MKHLFIPLICICSISCDLNTQPKCALGAPQAIFSKDLAGVTDHHFEVKGQESLEELMLERGVYLKVYQTGCEELRQEFQFLVQGDYASYPDSLWLREAVRQFYHLGNLSEKTAGLKMWASAIEAVRTDMRMAEPKQLDQNIYVQVDKVVSAEESTLRVILLQK
jgi:hypothetical protein